MLQAVKAASRYRNRAELSAVRRDNERLARKVTMIRTVHETITNTTAEIRLHHVIFIFHIMRLCYIVRWAFCGGTRAILGVAATIAPKHYFSWVSDSIQRNSLICEIASTPQQHARMKIYSSQWPRFPSSYPHIRRRHFSCRRCPARPTASIYVINTRGLHFCIRLVFGVN